jgi:glutamyl-tRNA(Gln) amidotransferase subunit D
MEEPLPGDIVKVDYDNKTIEGMLMPRAGIMDKSITVIKLESGYNIGIKNSRIKSKVLLKRYIPKPAKKEQMQKNPKLQTVSILSTGGTISSKIDYNTGGVHADYTAEDFVQMLPELKDIANIKAKKIMSLMSEDISLPDIAQIAKEVHKEINDSSVSGIIVSSGTDCLHYISAGLSFFLSDLAKPVLVIGAQRSIDRSSSDAFMNLSCAVHAAANFDGAEVVTCLHGSADDDYCLLIRGTKVRKMHTSRRDAFRPINEKALAKVYVDGKIEIINKRYNKRTNAKTILNNGFEEKVCQILAYPGQDPEIIDFYTDKGYKGIVIAATALGHVATNSSKSLIPGIKRAIKKNIPVIIASQTIYGRTHPHVYTNLRKLSIESGCIFAEDMLPEVAYIKLSQVLGCSHDLKKVKELMQTNLKGEINPRLKDDDFLY